MCFVQRLEPAPGAPKRMENYTGGFRVCTVVHQISSALARDRERRIAEASGPETTLYSPLIVTLPRAFPQCPIVISSSMKLSEPHRLT
jgi:hypothetical protein